jgi:hypothetical protein
MFTARDSTYVRQPSHVSSFLQVVPLIPGSELYCDDVTGPRCTLACENGDMAKPPPRGTGPAPRERKLTPYEQGYADRIASGELPCAEALQKAAALLAAWGARDEAKEDGDI